MIFKHLELTVTHDWGLWAADHEGSWKQEQLAYSDNQEGSRCFLYMVESLNLNSLAFFPTEESQPKHYSQWQVPLRTRAIHPQRGILFFIYNSRKETQFYYWVGLKKKKNKYFYSGRQFHMWAKPSGFVTWYSPQSQISKAECQFLSSDWEPTNWPDHQQCFAHIISCWDKIFSNLPVTQWNHNSYICKQFGPQYFPP